MKTRRYKHGLSLVEMLIVVGLIALLATMVVSVASRIDTQAKEKSIESTFALLEGALEEYKEFQGVFPEQSAKDFVNVPAHSEYLYGELYSIPGSRKILEKISNTLIKNQYSPAGVSLVDTPQEIYDAWGTALDYRYVAGENYPELVSAGPDKIFGNTDDITNRSK